MKLEKDTTILHYKILSEIGKGGMGEVWLAQDGCVRSPRVSTGFRNKNGALRFNSLTV
ncbi:MAG: hypothetical protein HKN25_13605 [Pyrinomonadaceae bacterium]|nr:hypothetical protein [Pyrinomonadaceae bacterium]